MAKAITTTLTTVSDETVKVDKLSDRTYRTVKVGDYLYTSTKVRGQAVFFYGKVVTVTGQDVVLSFGTHGKTVSAVLGKGTKYNVYRPL